MIVKTLWATRRLSPTPELLEAWDEYSVDSNPEGWEAAKQEALESLGTDLHEYRVLDVFLGDDWIARAFRTPVVVGDVRT